MIQPSDRAIVAGLLAARDADFYGRPHTMLERLEHEHIVSIETEPDGTVRLTECCDNWYSVELTKVEFSQLIDELSQLRDRIEG